MTGRLRLLWAALFAAVAAAAAAAIAAPAVHAGISFRALDRVAAPSEEHRPRFRPRAVSRPPNDSLIPVE
jgi:hypothetical protein